MMAGTRGFDALAARLRAKAERLALARMARQRGDSRRWRRAALLWPLFTKG